MISIQRLRTISKGAVVPGDLPVVLANIPFAEPRLGIGCGLGICGRMKTEMSSIAASDPAALRQIQILRCAE